MIRSRRSQPDQRRQFGDLRLPAVSGHQLSAGRADLARRLAVLIDGFQRVDDFIDVAFSPAFGGAPEIVEAILDGRQPADMTLAGLMRPFPVIWREQIGILIGEKRRT